MPVFKLVWILLPLLTVFASTGATNRCDICQSSGSVIDLSNCGFYSIEQAINKSCNAAARSATDLNLSGNFISNISNHDFTLPDNTGYFWNLEKLHLNNNSIRHIDENALKTLRFLSFLDLSYNNLTNLENEILEDKTLLKSVDFSHNQINFIGISVFKYQHNALREVHLAHNQLVSMEPWPYIPPSLTKFDVSHNDIVNFTNRMNWVYDLREPYHATVDLRYNQLRDWRDDHLKQYNPKPDADYYVDFVTYNLDIRENPWFCDCYFYGFTSRYQNSFFKHADTTLIEMKCDGPPNLRGKSIVEDVDLNDLVCNITLDCPQDCLCQDIPAESMMHVNCNNKSLTRLPSIIPRNHKGNYSEKLTLEMNQNQIKTLSHENYTSLLVVLSVSGNQLEVIEDKAFEGMTKLQHLDLTYNKIREIPKSVQYLIKYEDTKLSHNNFQCTCNMLWMADWINFAPIDDPNRDLQCTFEDEDVYNIREVNKNLLNCTYDVAIGLTIGFSILLALVIVAVVWAKRCPYETKVILYRIFRYHPWDKYRVDKELIAEYDAYVSFDDNNIHIRQWVLRKFAKRLEEEKPRYKFFVPVRDLLGGDGKADSIIENMEKSKRVIIILSDKYDENEWCRFECQRAEILELNNGRIIFIKYHPEADEMIESEPWKSRVKGRKVFSPGEKKNERRWFWGKIKYELPIR